MITLKNIYDAIDAIAPFSTAESWDNSGILVDASDDEPIKKVLLTLDITADVVFEARHLGAKVIVAHHPVIFHALRSLSANEPAYWLVKYGISAICAHTNLDLAVGGVSDILAHRLLLHNIQPLGEPDSNGLSLGRIGDLELEVDPQIYMRFIKENLGCGAIRYTQGKGKLRRVAVCGGSGAELLSRARELGADALVTGEAKHNQLLLAPQLGIVLIDAGHQCTEQVVLDPLARHLGDTFPELEFALAQCGDSTARYL